MRRSRVGGRARFVNGNGMEYVDGAGFANVDGTGYVNVGGGKAYTPIVRFRTQDGQEVTAEPRTNVGLSRTQVGDQVPVLYDPAKPRSIMLEGEKRWTPSFLLGVGGLIMIGGVALLISTLVS